MFSNEYKNHRNWLTSLKNLLYSIFPHWWYQFHGNLFYFVKNKRNPVQFHSIFTLSWQLFQKALGWNNCHGKVNTKQIEYYWIIILFVFWEKVFTFVFQTMQCLLNVSVYEDIYFEPSFICHIWLLNRS